MIKPEDFLNNIKNLKPSEVDSTKLITVPGPKGEKGDSASPSIHFIYSNTKPNEDLFEGLVWFHSKRGKAYVYMTDGNSNSWFVDIYHGGTSTTSGLTFSFPESPAPNQTYTYIDRTWMWNTEAWDLVVSNTGVSGNYIRFFSGPSSSPPILPNEGDVWFETGSGIKYTRIYNTWVQI